MIKVAVAGRENHFNTGANHALHDTLYIGVLWNILEMNGFHIVHVFFQIETALILGVVVSIVRFWSNVDEADFGVGGSLDTDRED